MTKKFNLETAEKDVFSALPIMDNEISNEIEIQNPIENQEVDINYYNAETKKPLPLEIIESRVQKNLDKMNKLSVDVMRDLSFIHSNWKTFYKRDDCFIKYLRKNFPISQNYAFVIIKIVRMLTEHNNIIVSNLLNGSTNSKEILNNPINSIGVKKLKCVSQINNPKTRHNVLTKLIKGNKMTEKEIYQINKDSKNKQCSNDKTNTNIELNGNNILIEDKAVLTFLDVDEAEKLKIFNLIKRYYKKQE